MLIPFFPWDFRFRTCSSFFILSGHIPCEIHLWNPGIWGEIKDFWRSSCSWPRSLSSRFLSIQWGLGPGFVISNYFVLDWFLWVTDLRNVPNLGSNCGVNWRSIISKFQLCSGLISMGHRLFWCWFVVTTEIVDARVILSFACFLFSVNYRSFWCWWTPYRNSRCLHVSGARCFCSLCETTNWSGVPPGYHQINRCLLVLHDYGLFCLIRFRDCFHCFPSWFLGSAALVAT